MAVKVEAELHPCAVTDRRKLLAKEDIKRLAPSGFNCGSTSISGQNARQLSAFTSAGREYPTAYRYNLINFIFLIA